MGNPVRTLQDTCKPVEVPEVYQACMGRHHGICGALNSEQLRRLSQASRKRRVEAGQTLVSAEEPAPYFANILAGVVKLSKMLPDGRQQIVGLQFAPDFLGRPFRAESRINAEAATNVSLCSFPRPAIERLMKDSPGLEHRLLEQTLKELDEARDWMVTLGRKTASEKVASFLLLIARNIDPGTASSDGRAVAFDLPLTRADIADFLGLTIETVSRQFTKLRVEGLIRIENNRHVTVADLSRLEFRSGS